MSDQPLRMAVIGAGWFASRRHLPVMAQHPEIQVTALCRRDPEALRKLAEHFGVPVTYTDYQLLLESEPLDAVLIASPHGLHYEHAKAALQKGLHVLLEKPMAVRAVEARELGQIARERRLVVEVAFNPPFWSHCHRLRQWMDSEAFGELETANLHWCVSSVSARTQFGRKPMPADLPGIVPPTGFRGDAQLSGGGNLLDGGSHVISALLWTTGRQVASVTARMDEVPMDVRASVLLVLDNGGLATVNFVANSASDRKRVRETYFGSGGAVLEVEGQPFVLKRDLPGVPMQRETESDWSPAPQPVENFVDVIRGRAANLSPPEHGVAVTAVLEAAYQSAAEGRTVGLMQGSGSG